MSIPTPLVMRKHVQPVKPVQPRRSERWEWQHETLAWVTVGETVRLKHNGPLFQVVNVDEVLGKSVLEPTLGGRPIALGWNCDNGKNRPLLVWRPERKEA